MEWHWLPFALIGAILWIIQNVRSQQPPPPPMPRRQPIRDEPEPAPRAQAPAPRPGRKGRSRESGEGRAPSRPRPPAPPAVALNVAPDLSPMAKVDAALASSATMPTTPRGSSSTARRAAVLLKQPDSAAVAFVLREILDEPLCKRGRRRR
jgi:hypothetical protein